LVNATTKSASCRSCGAQRVAAAELPADPLATSGRGLFILQRLADDVRVDAEGGLCLTIRSPR